METKSEAKGQRVALIVAHPDDETLWAGGLLLTRPEWRVFIVCLNHRDDRVRNPHFHRALELYKARGAMGNLRDGGREDVLPEGLVEDTIMALLPDHRFDLVITHSPQGEYTEHRFHDEVSDAVSVLRRAGRLEAAAFWQFAYEDEHGAGLPHAARGAALRLPLADPVWTRKRQVITDIYGFGPEAWETLVTPKVEAFNPLAE
jgi:LmbE family N-acetylglucosaminyl deacetylase